MIKGVVKQGRRRACPKGDGGRVMDKASLNQKERKVHIKEMKVLHG